MMARATEPTKPEAQPTPARVRVSVPGDVCVQRNHHMTLSMNDIYSGWIAGVLWAEARAHVEAA